MATRSDVLRSEFMGEILHQCQDKGLGSVWNDLDVLVLVAGVLANAALLLLFLKEGTSLSASKVFGLNLVLMDFFFLAMMPFSLILNEVQGVERNATESSRTPMEKARSVFDMFNMVGCPLLLACMCAERYLAVMRPVAYLRLRKWEYKAAVCGAVWAVTCSFCVATGVLEDGAGIIVSVSVVVSFLFVVMLACLGGIVWSLRRRSPVHGDSPLKRKAVGNVLAVVAPTLMSYLPVLLTLPAVLYIFYWTKRVDQQLCHVFKASLFFPKLGVLIAPAFYLSRARQVCCPTGGGAAGRK